MVARASSELSPVKRAKGLLYSINFSGLSQPMRSHLYRIDKLNLHILDLLDCEEAPFRVCRWIGWGRFHHTQAVRLALAFFTRREASETETPGQTIRSASGWSWAKDHLLASAERLFRKTPQFTELVRKGLLVEHSRTAPAIEMTRLWTAAWPESFVELEREMSTVDRVAFLKAAEQDASKRTRRRRVRSALPQKITAEQSRFLDKLDALKREALHAIVPRRKRKRTK